MIIDTHSHIYSKEFDADRADSIKNGNDLGVGIICMPNIDVDSIAKLYKAELDYPGTCFSMMGLHPCSVKDDYKSQLAFMENELSLHDFIAIGEIGLDYYWDKTFIPEQIEAFRYQIDWALDRNLPIVIHSRDSITECMDIVEEKQNGNLRGVFHCFGGSMEEFKRIQSLGFYAGLGGVITFKKVKLRDQLSKDDFSHIVLETDSPYLAPVPYRGKRNESKYLKEIVECLSGATGIAPQEIIDLTTRNAFNLFPRLKG